MSGLDMLDNNFRSRQYATHIPTSFSNVAFTRMAAVAYESPDSIPNVAMSLDIGKETHKRNELIKQRFGTNDPFSLIDVSDIDEQYSNPTVRGRIAAGKLKLERLDQFITEQREIDPEAWAGIKTKAEIDSPMIERARVAREVADDVMSRAESDFAGIGGTLAGGFGGAMTGVINLATLPVGFGAGRGVLQTMAAEGVLNAAIEAVQVPGRKEWMETLGHKYGLKEAAGDVAFAAVGAAGLTGLIRGGGAAVRSITGRGSKGMEVMSEMSDDPSLPKDARDALKYQSRIAHVDESNPKANPGREDVAINRQNLDETQRAWIEGREPIYRDFSDLDWRLAAFSNENIARILRRYGDNAALSFGERFNSRKAADDYVRQSAKDLGVDRGDFIVERSGDGFDVYQAHRGVSFVKDDAGGIFAAKSFADAKKMADEMNAADSEGVAHYPINLKPDQGKGTQSFHVISGKGLTPESAARIRSNPAMFLERERGEVVFGDRVDVVSVSDDVAADVGTFIDGGRNFEALRAGVEASEQAQQSFAADFGRLLMENPNMRIDVDGEPMTVRQIADMIQENEDVLNAMKVCAIG